MLELQPVLGILAVAGLPVAAHGAVVRTRSLLSFCVGPSQLFVIGISGMAEVVAVLLVLPVTSGTEPDARAALYTRTQE